MSSTTHEVWFLALFAECLIPPGVQRDSWSNRTNSFHLSASSIQIYEAPEIARPLYFDISRVQIYRLREIFNNPIQKFVQMLIPGVASNSLAPHSIGQRQAKADD
jgi:hypothetical protein